MPRGGSPVVDRCLSPGPSDPLTPSFLLGVTPSDVCAPQPLPRLPAFPPPAVHPSPAVLWPRRPPPLQRPLSAPASAQGPLPEPHLQSSLSFRLKAPKVPNSLLISQNPPAECPPGVAHVPPSTSLAQAFLRLDCFISHLFFNLSYLNFYSPALPKVPS